MVTLCCVVSCCAGKFGLNVNLVAKGDNKSVPARDSWKLSPDAKYVHYCDNETIGGEAAKEVTRLQHSHTKCDYICIQVFLSQHTANTATTCGPHMRCAWLLDFYACPVATTSSS